MEMLNSLRFFEITAIYEHLVFNFTSPKTNLRNILQCLNSFPSKLIIIVLLTAASCISRSGSRAKYTLDVMA